MSVIMESVKMPLQINLSQNLSIIKSTEARVTRARNLRKFSNKFLYSCVHEQYSSNKMSIHSYKNMHENLRKLIAHGHQLKSLVNNYVRSFSKKHIDGLL